VTTQPGSKEGIVSNRPDMPYLRSHDGMGEGERTPTGSAVVRVEEAPW
jgi:hypothetical protein